MAPPMIPDWVTTPAGTAVLRGVIGAVGHPTV